MSLQHFFLDEQVIARETEDVFPLQLSRDDLRHFKVLRIRNGEYIAVIDASQDYFECEIVSACANDDQVLVRISKHLNNEQSLPKVLLVQGIAKGEKMDEIVRHVTELGASRIVPFICDRSVVKLDKKKALSKTQRWQAIAKSASMQSGRTSIMEVDTPRDIHEVIEIISKTDAVLICWEEAQNAQGMGAALRSALNGAQFGYGDELSVALIVGPEGGLTKEEVETIKSAGSRAELVSLGSTILRTETAGTVATALAMYELGGLGNSNCSEFCSEFESAC